MRAIAFASAIAAAVLVTATPVAALEAGGSVMQQHRQELKRQQPLPGQRGPDPTVEMRQRQMEAEIKAVRAQQRRQLTPEYERRVQRDGRPAADQWLRDEERRQGEEAGRAIQRKYGLD